MLGQFLYGDFDQLRERFNQRMTDALTAGRLQSARSRLTHALGDALETGAPDVTLRMGYTVVDTPMSSPKGSYKARFALDADGFVAGSFLLTPEAL